MDAYLEQQRKLDICTKAAHDAQQQADALSADIKALQALKATLQAQTHTADTELPELRQQAANALLDSKLGRDTGKVRKAALTAIAKYEAMQDEYAELSPAIQARINQLAPLRDGYQVRAASAEREMHSHKRRVAVIDALAGSSFYSTSPSGAMRDFLLARLNGVSAEALNALLADAAIWAAVKDKRGSQ